MDELLQVIEDFHETRRIYDPFNSTFIALIPNINESKSFDEYKPVSLCNCIYQIIAKIIVMPLRSVMSINMSRE